MSSPGQLGLGRPSSRPGSSSLAQLSTGHNLATSSKHNTLLPSSSQSDGRKAVAGRRVFSGQPREVSGGLYQTFTEDQVRQFRDAFSMIDTDADGKITEKDLEVFLSNMGKPTDKTYIDALLTNKSRYPGSHGQSPSQDDDDSYDLHSNQRSNPSGRSLNFTQFLTMFCQRLLPFSNEQEMIDAFGCWDENDDGAVEIEEMRNWIREWGPGEDTDIERLFDSSFTDKRKGTFNYLDMAAMIRIQDDEMIAKKAAGQK